MRKILVALILVFIVFISALSFGQEEVLSNIIEPEAVGTPQGEVIEVSLPQETASDVEQVEREQSEVNTDLSYEEVLKLINDTGKKIVNDSENILVLVNKENNLPSTYLPQDLTKPNVAFSFAGDDQKQNMRMEAALALEKLVENAAENGHEIVAVSGFRSYERQKSIFLENVKRVGFKKANTFSAVPGQSEHQTGLAMDVSCASVNYRLVEKFGETPEGIWVKENAHLFGFIIRYPKDKTEITGYQYEPWHLRYVGVESAGEIMENGLTLEEYLHNK
ncbi:MAG: M15 family metallopeptidase [Bacillota bacterium]